MSNMTLPCVNPIQLVPTIQKRAESCLQGSPRPRHKSQLMICPKQLPSKQAIPFHLHLESWKENNDHRCRLQGFESEPSCGNLQSVESCNFAVVSFVCLHLAGDAVLQHTIQWHSCKILCFEITSQWIALHCIERHCGGSNCVFISIQGGALWCHQVDEVRMTAAEMSSLLWAIVICVLLILQYVIF